MRRSRNDDDIDALESDLMGFERTVTQLQKSLIDALKEAA